MANRAQGYIDDRTGAVIGPTSGKNQAATPYNRNDFSAPGTSTTGSVNSGMEPYTGFASRYAPGALQSAVYDNPWYLLPDVFQGISTNSPGYQYLRDFGGDPLSLYNIMTGGSGTIDGGEGQFANFMAELYRNLGTPGGQGFSATELLSNIFGADDNSTLGNILNAGDMNTQIRTLFNLLRDASQVSMNPLAARGYQAAVARQGDLYGNAMLKSDAGATMGPREWMSQNAPWLTVR